MQERLQIDLGNSSDCLFIYILMYFFFLQSLRMVNQTLGFLPLVAIKIQGNGCLKILTNGSVILVIPEHTFSWVMQVLAKVL